MNEVLRPFFDLFHDVTQRKLVALVDIALVSLLIYKLLTLIRGARAWRIIAGVALFGVLLFVSKALQLHTLYWILDKAALLGPVALVILLLPELRQAIEGFGRLGVWTQWLVLSQENSRIQAATVEEIVAAAAEMASARTGAIVIIERQSVLSEIINSGVMIDAKVSASLIVSLFYDKNPLHDGAAVIRGDRVVAAACRLPLSESLRIAPTMHMRHRAGIGVSELYDCISVMVSEERGTIAVAVDGDWLIVEGPGELREVLNRQWRLQGEPGRPRLSMFKGAGRK